MATNGNGHGNLQSAPASNFFTNLTTEGPQLPWAYIGIEGPQGSGKSVTGALIALGLSVKYHNRAPVVWPDTEGGANFLQPIFAAEKVDLLWKPTSSLVVLRETIRMAKRIGACVILPDSLTKFWRTTVRAYMEKYRITTMQQMLPHWQACKEPWFDMLDELKDAEAHKVICGRGGFEFETIDVLNADGEVTGTESVRGAHKMKAEGETGHEPDINLHMQSIVDPTAPATARQKVGRRLRVAPGGPRKIHVASIEKGRCWALNGKTFQWRDRDTYKPGEFKLVLDCLEPYLSTLTIGGKSHAVAVKDSEGMFREHQSNGNYTRKQKALEVWAATMSIIFPSQTTEDKQRRKLVGERITGTLSATAMKQQDVEAIEFQVAHLNKLRQRIEGGEGIPKLDKDLIAMIELAHLEASEDWKILHPPPGEPLTEQEMEQPF